MQKTLEERPPSPAPASMGGGSHDAGTSISSFPSPHGLPAALSGGACGDTPEKSDSCGNILNVSAPRNPHPPPPPPPHPLPVCSPTSGLGSKVSPPLQSDSQCASPLPQGHDMSDAGKVTCRSKANNLSSSEAANFQKRFCTPQFTQGKFSAFLRTSGSLYFGFLTFFLTRSPHDRQGLSGINSYCVLKSLG